MSVIAWITLGLAAGLIANVLIPGRRQRGLILTYVIGIVGAARRLDGNQALPHPQPAGVLLPVYLADRHRRRGHPAARIPPHQQPVLQPARPVRTPLTAAEGLRLSGWPRRRTAPGEDVIPRRPLSES
jgi:hypothetical protein